MPVSPFRYAQDAVVYVAHGIEFYCEHCNCDPAGIRMDWRGGEVAFRILPYVKRE